MMLPFTPPNDGEVTADFLITPAEDIVEGICLMTTPLPLAIVGGKNEAGFTFFMY